MATTIRLVKPREEVVTRRVVDSFDVPAIDFNHLKMEVATSGQGLVFLNGVLLKGLRLDKSYFSGPYKRTYVDLLCPNGYRQRMFVDEIVLILGDIPSDAKFVDTRDEQGNVVRMSIGECIPKKLEEIS